MAHKCQGMGAKGALDGHSAAEREPDDESWRENTGAFKSML